MLIPHNSAYAQGVGKQRNVTYNPAMGIPQLRYRQDFLDILAHYSVSEQGQELLKQAHLVALVGATAAGRQTLINALLRNHPETYHSLISDTTRPPKVRNGQLERDGFDYFFRDEAEMLEDLRRGEYLEAALIHNQQVSGISLREIKRAIDAGKIALSEMQFNGAANIHAAKPDATIIFVLPPNFETWMRRIQGRGDLQGDELKRRLTSALIEFDEAVTKPYYQLFVNDDVTRSAEHLHQILTGQAEPPEPRIARAIVDHLRFETAAYVKSHFA